jgi:hypothetical protein
VKDQPDDDTIDAARATDRPLSHALVVSLRMSVALGPLKLSYPLLYEFEFRGMVRHAAGALERVDRRTSLASPAKELAEKHLVGIRTHGSRLPKTLFRSFQIACGFVNPSKHVLLRARSVKATNIVLLGDVSRQTRQAEKRQPCLSDCHKKV